eukprot:scaffold94602_cov63-Phaeocystis_antarctica.AAC.4
MVQACREHAESCGEHAESSGAGAASTAISGCHAATLLSSPLLSSPPSPPALPSSGLGSGPSSPLAPASPRGLSWIGTSCSLDRRCASLPEESPRGAAAAEQGAGRAAPALFGPPPQGSNPQGSSGTPRSSGARCCRRWASPRRPPRRGAREAQRSAEG